MSIPVIQNLGTFRAGDALDIGVVITSDGEPADLTSCTAIFRVARTPSSDPVLSSEESPSNATAVISNPSEGAVDLTADDEATEDLDGTYQYEVKILDGTGKMHTPLAGVISWERRID